MPRIKAGKTTRKRKKKIFRAAKGYRLGKKNRYRQMTEQVDKSLQYAYRDRRTKKRFFRSLWISRINAACRLQGLSYSRFMEGLKKAKINLDRKSIAALSVEDDKSFSELAIRAKEALAK